MATRKTLTTNGDAAIFVSPPTDSLGGLQLSGTWTGTVQFEASVDNGATWIALGGWPIASGVLSSPIVTSATANGVWQFPMAGFTHFRVRCSAAMTGSLVVDYETTPGDGLVPSNVAIASVAPTASQAYDVQTTITRPANTTPYTAGDVLGGALDLGVLGPSGKPVMIETVELEADIAAVPAGQTTWNLHLYSVTPPSAVADNGAFDIPAGDRASYLTTLQLGALTDRISTLVGSFDFARRVTLAGTHLFGYLETVGGFTPAANSEVYKVRMETRAV